MAANIPRETLVAELRQRGVGYLAPSDAQIDTPSSDACLIEAILSQSEARLKLALICWLIRKPSLANSMPAVLSRLSAEPALELQILYTAALYLQRFWWSQLGLYLPEQTYLPDLYSNSLGLPSPNERFGKVGLVALADFWAAKSAYPFNRLASLHKTFALFLEQLSREARPDLLMEVA